MSDETMMMADAKRRAQIAFDAMCNDPEIWLTHGTPSQDKEARIVVIIAEAIMSAISWRETTKALLNMERARQAET